MVRRRVCSLGSDGSHNERSLKYVAGSVSEEMQQWEYCFAFPACQHPGSPSGPLEATMTDSFLFLHAAAQWRLLAYNG